MVSAKRIIELRKKLIIEERDLVFERSTINKRLAEIRKESYGVDNIIIKDTITK